MFVVFFFSYSNGYPRYVFRKVMQKGKNILRTSYLLGIQTHVEGDIVPPVLLIATSPLCADFAVEYDDWLTG